MDLRKFRLFNSGLSEDEIEAIAKKETVEVEFKKEAEMVRTTVRTKGWQFIINKVVAEMELQRAKLLDCSKEDLNKIQERIKIRKEFLDEWTPYIE